MSPQVVKRSYVGDKADVWSCGVVCHVMMTGYAPFDGEEYKDILKAIVKGKFDFEDPEWDGASDKVKVRGVIDFYLSGYHWVCVFTSQPLLCLPCDNVFIGFYLVLFNL